MDKGNTQITAPSDRELQNLSPLVRTLLRREANFRKNAAEVAKPVQKKVDIKLPPHKINTKLPMGEDYKKMESKLLKIKPKKVMPKMKKPFVDKTYGGETPAVNSMGRDLYEKQYPKARAAGNPTRVHTVPGKPMPKKPSKKPMEKNQSRLQLGINNVINAALEEESLSTLHGMLNKKAVSEGITNEYYNRSLLAGMLHSKASRR